MLLSIIIPVYNTPVNLLEHCFRSLNNLNLPSYEVIVVDNASNNETADFLKKYVKSTPNFKYILQPILGVSSARNMGIEISLGQYTLFLDSDDYIFSGTLESFFLDNFHNADYIIFDQKGSTKEIISFPNKKEGFISWEEPGRQLINNSFSHFACALYKSNFIKKNSIYFPINCTSGEDIFFQMNVISNKPQTYYIHKPLYYYNYSESHSSLRILNHPELIIKNRILLSHMKKNFVFEMYTSLEDQSHMLDNINKDLINSLFSYLLFLVYMRKLNSSIKKTISDEFKNMTLDSKYSYKYFLKRWLVINKHWTMLLFISYIRKIKKIVGRY